MWDSFKDWVASIIPDGEYAYSRGQWVDNDATAKQMIVAIIGIDSPEPDVQDRRPQFRVIMLGKRGERSDVTKLDRDIESLALAALGDSRPCGAAYVKAKGEPMGPSFTTENRAYYVLDFQMIV